MRCTPAALTLMLLAACSSTPQSYDELPEELRAATVISTFEPGAAIPDTATFSWMPGSSVHVDERYDAAALDLQIRRTLEEALLRRGMYLVPESRGDLWVGFAVAVEGALDGARLDSIYGITHQQTQQHERGALVLDICDRVAKRPLWRGSVAILADASLPEELRQARVERGVEQLLDQFKPGY